MKTKIKILLSLVFAFVILISTKVYAGTTGDLTYTIDTSNKTAEITACKASAVNVTIPSKVESGKYTVTSINGNAFQQHTNLKSVIIPSTVTNIDGSAFYKCTNLTTLTINAKIEEIPSYMCYECGKLSSVTIPKGVVSIGTSAFEGCYSLKNVSFPNTLKSLGWHTFEGCTSLTEVSLPNSFEELDWSTFAGCTKLSKVTLPNKITSIPRNCFENCTSLKSLILPEKTEGIYEGAFAGSGLENITIPSKVDYVVSNAFENCKNLNYVVIPKNVTNVVDGYNFKDARSNFKLYVEDDSKAYEWAVNNNVNYKIITPAKVKNVRATSQTKNAIKYQWNAVSGVTGYKIYVYNYKTAKWEYYGKTTKTAMIINNLTPATINKIKVRAYVNIDGVQYFGPYSAAVRSATRAKLSKITSTATSSKSASIKWKNLGSVTGYKIYMSTSENGPYTKVATVKSSIIKYTKTGLTSGKTYYFKVRAYKTVDGVQIFGPYSSPVAIKVK
ncbi:MAG: fibronectin type III domain-containing protein [Clostridia bacterium]|nr:fibronectin type III domain-containing protein [Clostridia bacterium]